MFKRNTPHKLSFFVASLGVFLALSLIRLDPTPYSTDEMNYKDICALLSQGKLFTKKFVPAFIKINNTYYPSQPIGFPLLALPFYSLFKLENSLVASQPLYYFSNGFYPPENDDRGTFYWLKSNGTILVYSKKNDLIKMGFSGISFGKSRRIKIIFKNETIFEKTLSVYPEWYETYFPARKGWNELKIHAGKCLSVSQVKGTDDWRCVSLMVLNPKFEYFVAKPWIERSEVYTFKGNESLKIKVFNPNTFPVKAKLNFVVKSTKNTTLIVRIGNKTFNYQIYTFPVEFFTPFVTLPPNASTLIFETKTKECDAYLSRINFYLEKDFYDEDFVYLDGWFLEESSGRKKWRWATQNATLKVFEKEIELTVWSYAKPHTLRIFENGNEVKKVKIFPTPKKVKIKLQKVPTLLDFQVENCSIPNLNEKSLDYRCLGFGISK